MDPCLENLSNTNSRRETKNRAEPRRRTRPTRDPERKTQANLPTAAPAEHLQASTQTDSRRSATSPTAISATADHDDGTRGANEATSDPHAEQTTPRATHTLAEAWKRDLTEEGIEPNPGPSRFITKNLGSIGGLPRWEQILLAIRDEHKARPITAIFLQETGIRKVEDFKRKASTYGFELFAVPLYTIGPNNSQHQRGGTAILIPKDKIESHPGETYHDTVDRMKKNMRRMSDGRGVSVPAMVDGRPLRLASVYAHADGSRRPEFFKKELRRFLTKQTVLGIDANCVPDVQLDVRSDAASPYDNRGANELADVMTHFGLVDVAREWLGPAPFYTSHHNITLRDGTKSTTSTRIDQIYLPTLDGLSAVHEPGVHDFFARKRDAKILDHEPASIVTTESKGERGHDLARIDERIYDDPKNNTDIAAILEKCEHDQENAPGHHSEIWAQTKKDIVALSLVRTKKMKRTESAEQRQIKLKISTLKSLIDQGQALPDDVTEYLEAREEQRRITREELTPYFASEEFALKQGAAHHDTGSAAFYRPVSYTHLTLPTIYSV